MNVNEIRDRIVELSHQSAGDGEVQGKALGWLNAAYHELMDEVVAYLPPALQRREQVVTAADGVAVLAWNTLQLHPKLKDLRVSGDGESLTLVSTDNSLTLLKLDDVIAELQQLLKA